MADHLSGESPQQLNYATPIPQRAGKPSAWIIWTAILLVLLSMIPFMGIIAITAHGDGYRGDWVIAMLGAAGLAVLGTGLYLIVAVARHALRQ